MTIIKSFAVPVTGTGTYKMSNLQQHGLSGWYFTETGGVNSITVTIQKDTSSGTIIEQLSIAAGKSVGEDYAKPIMCQQVYVTISGLGTCQGHVRGQ